MKPKYPLKKSDRRCALTQLAGKKYDSVNFVIRNVFTLVRKVKNSVKQLLNAIFRCALTQLADKKYDSVNFAIRIIFEQV